MMIPFYRRLLIETELQPEEVLRRLNEVLEVKRFLRNPFARDHRAYEGQVTGQSFSMNRIIHHRNSFLPMVFGQIEAQGRGARVRIRMRPHLAMCAFFLLWMSWLIYPFLYWRAFGSLLVVGAVCVFFAFGFAREAQRTAEFLCKLCNGAVTTEHPGDRA